MCGSWDLRWPCGTTHTLTIICVCLEGRSQAKAILPNRIQVHLSGCIISYSSHLEPQLQGSLGGGCACVRGGGGRACSAGPHGRMRMGGCWMPSTHLPSLSSKKWYSCLEPQLQGHRGVQVPPEICCYFLPHENFIKDKAFSLSSIWL